MLRSVRLARGADGLLSPAEQHLFEAYQLQAARCAAPQRLTAMVTLLVYLHAVHQ